MPNDPAFQRSVLLSALRLLEAKEGPVIVDFPDDAPVAGGEPVILACPWVPPLRETGDGEKDRLTGDFRMEMSAMRPWYDRALKQRGRTAVGLSGLAPEVFGDFFAAFLAGGLPENPRPEVTIDFSLRYAADDLKAYYYESVTAQPGAGTLTSAQVDDWFWHETMAGKMLRAVREVCLQSQDEALKRTAGGSIIPMTQLPPHAGAPGR